VGKLIKLSKYEYVVCCWPESCCGPGWANRIINIIVYDHSNGSYRKHSLQPEDYFKNKTILALFESLELLNLKFTKEVQDLVKPVDTRRCNAVQED